MKEFSFSSSRKSAQNRAGEFFVYYARREGASPLTGAQKHTPALKEEEEKLELLMHT